MNGTSGNRVGSRFKLSFLVRSVICLALCSAPIYAATLAGYNSANVNIPDYPGNQVNSSVVLSGAAAGSQVTSIDIYYEIRHFYSGDLKVWLTAYYDGAWHDFVLRNRTGGAADDIVESRNGLTFWNGASPNQTWYLVAQDLASGDVGYIDYFQIAVNYSTPLPNLTPTQPGGWSDKIVVSRTTGTMTDSAGLTTADTLYVDWAVINNGNASTGVRFYTELYVDGVLRTSWYTDPPMGINSVAWVTDYAIGTLSAGNHTLRIKTDSSGNIGESSEGDNEYTKTIAVSNPSQPNLMPTQPGGWSDKIVVSTTTGTSTDSTGLTSADTLYLDWAIINNGNASTAVRFYTELYVDGVLRTSWYTDPPMTANATAWITDYSIGTLGAGTHTLRIKTDSSGVIGESNEGDNEYTKTISISNPTLPNLTPYLPAGWSDKIVVSRTTGNNTDSGSLTTADILYVDWAVINNGNAATAARFYTALYVDGTLRTSWYTDPPVNANYYTYVTDYSIGSLSAGTHTITITTDSTGTITESNEGDNSYTKTITVASTSKPNLTPYQGPGWSDKIVVSRTTGTTTDGPALTTADTLYVDWAVINNGTLATAVRFYTEIYVDGVLRTSWYTDPPINTGDWQYVQDYSIGQLSAGTHTIKVKTDSTGVIAEGNEGDNEYTKTISVGQGVIIPSLQNGVAVDSLSGTLGSQLFYKITMPSGQAKMDISIAGGAGDCDLYIKYGSAPSTSSYDYRPYVGGNNETVSISNPASGDWYIMLNAYASYSGVTLLASYSSTTPTVATPQISPGSGSYNNSVLVSISTTTSGANIYYTLDGSDPTTSSTLYTGSVTLLNSATVKARAYKSGMNASGIASRSYTVTPLVTVLQNNVPVDNISGALGGQRLYKIVVPSGQTKVTVSISGGSGDCDLYVRLGAAPTTSVYDYRPYSGGNNETVTINSPASGDWYVMLNGYNDYSGVTLLATYESVAVTAPILLQNNVPVTGLSGSSSSEAFYKIVVPFGQSRLEIRTYGGTGDCDLYVKVGAQPTTGDYTFRSVLAGNNESIMIPNSSAGIWYVPAGTWYIMLKGASAYSGITLDAHYGPTGGSTLFKATADALNINLFQRYSQGKKYLFNADADLSLGTVVTAGTVEFGPSVGLGLYLDLNDYLGVTAEGWTGDWITIWVRGHATAFGVGLPVSVAERTFNSSDRLPDREFELESSIFELDTPVWSISAVSGSSSGGVQLWDPPSFSEIGLSFGLFNIESPSVSIEVQRAQLDNAMLNAIAPNMALSLIPGNIMNYVFDPGASSKVDGNMQISWRLPLRIPSDKTDSSN